MNSKDLICCSKCKLIENITYSVKCITFVLILFFTIGIRWEKIKRLILYFVYKKICYSGYSHNFNKYFLFL
jgi:hypothetical protein